MFDLAGLDAALAVHGRVARVVIAATQGSSPREVGAALLVWDGGQSGTIGGGALEFAAVARARQNLTGGPRQQSQNISLGPALGQCCGGAVVLWTEVFDAPPLSVAGLIARGPGAMPLGVARMLGAARAQGVPMRPGLVQGWLVEPVAQTVREVWVWGAGHVGRVLVGVLAPLPGVALTWIDTAADRFPDLVPDGVRVLPVAAPELAVPLAPPDAEHLIVTYSHALDLELCHRLLAHGFASAGLIGSATKWARFRSRLAALGHSPAQVQRLRCPIGDPALGKHPQAIAVGVAADFLRARTATAQELRA